MMTPAMKWAIGLGPKPDLVTLVPAPIVFEKVYPVHRYSHEVHPGPKGCCVGEKCNRLGCVGIIDEHYQDDSCSCHINPPCSACTTPREYCPVCEWDAQEEAQEQWSAQLAAQKKWLTTPEGLAYQDREIERQQNNDIANKLFWAKFRGEVPVTVFETRIHGHTHFSQKVNGIFPAKIENDTWPYSATAKELVNDAEIMNKIRGSFGGRFENINKQSFVYIAYTD